MKKNTLLLILLLGISQVALAQMKPHLEDQSKPKPPKREVVEFNPRINPIAVPGAQRQLQASSLPVTQPAVLPSFMHNQQAQITKSENGQVIFMNGKIAEVEKVIDGKEADYYQQAIQYLTAMQEDLRIRQAEDEFELRGIEKDQLGQIHIRLQQTFQSTKVHGAELILHNVNGTIRHANGRIYPTPNIEQVYANLSKTRAVELAKSKIAKKTTIKELSADERKLISHAPVEAELVIFHQDKKLDGERVAWKVRLIPNLAQHWLLFIDANTGEILQEFDQICRLHDHLEKEHTCTGHHTAEEETNENLLPLDGPLTTNATDLNGVTRTINIYESNGAFFMIDASRAMFNNFQNDITNSPEGAVWTLDGQNGAPQRNDFEVIHNANTNNQWSNRTAVSAHYNAGVAYEYFRQTFNRNSIDGNGGTIISIINIADEEGRSMDNAFWNGQAMFYGNGAQAFTSPLAKSLDVAGHEMSHGVIQNTAGLEYYGESGALNESFADVFGVMMDRDDWGLGEDVVNGNFYRTGVLRSMSNPNNGGNSLSDLGWQPAHTDEQYFGREDNGGVHINSGIPNRAFFLFASDVGKSKAEQVFYRALANYLTRSSQFIDARLAVIQATKDLYGNNSTEVTAAENAFNTVGIGSGGGTGGGGGNGGNDDTIGTDLTALCEIESNPGQEFVVLTDESNSKLYLADGEGNLIENPYVDVEIKSKPSFTDDGTFGFFVAKDGTIRYINTTTGELNYLENNPQTIWRNVVISKDGSKLALTTDDQTAEILVFDFNSQDIRTLELSNATTAEGISTSSVEFVDAMEWDYDGEFLIYDAFNKISSGFGDDISYWDINFLQAWDKDRNDFGEGLVLPLFASLPENVSVGNPTFSKNSSCIIAFDYLDTAEGTYEILGANYETGTVETIFEGNTPGYPNYTKDDDAVVFDFLNSGEQVLAVQAVNADKISPSGDAFLFVNGGSWGTVIATGERTVTNTTQIGEHQIRVYPTAFEEELHIDLDGNEVAQIELYDLLGRRVLMQEIRTNTTLSTGNLQAGAYFLSIIIGTERSTQKLIKVGE